MIRRFAPVLALVSLALGSDVVAPLGTYTPAERKLWAFVKRGTPAVPVFTTPSDKAWVTNPVDAFILSKLHREGLQPSPPADRRILLRRVYFDLIGLPPTPAEMSAFLADRSPDAYQKLIEKLLPSPQCDERWTQQWLDVVHLGETDGHK